MATPSKSLLIVDDNAYMRHALSRLFGREGDLAVCGEAQNGKEAIEKAKALKPDLVVMDLSMPVMNGLEATRLLKRLMPTLPVILFSEYSSAITHEEAHSAGVAALVSKGQHASTLVLAARDLLHHTVA
jgi:DNA-binding NarL/FixJ family response regulator